MRISKIVKIEMRFRIKKQKKKKEMRGKISYVYLCVPTFMEHGISISKFSRVAEKKQFEAFCKTQIQLRSILFFISDLISPNIIDDFRRVRYRLTNRNEVNVILFLRYFHLTNFRQRFDRLFTEFNLTRQSSHFVFLRMSI